MHANATLTPLMRAKLIRHHLTLGASLRATALAFGVSDKTVRKWLQRAKAAGFPARLEDRSSVPLRHPRKTSPELEAHIIILRQQRSSYAQILMVLPISKASLFPHPPTAWPQPPSSPAILGCVHDFGSMEDHLSHPLLINNKHS